MTPNRIAAAFEAELVMLPLAALLPLGQVTDVVKTSSKYQCIARSIEEVGLVEPLVVYRKVDRRGRRLLLDGNLRRAILMEKGHKEAKCLLAQDDEAFTYNKRVNRLAIVQEHFMIIRALERGVSEEKLAKALDVDIAHVKRRRKLLNGICSEATGLLRDKSVNPVTFDVLRKMKPVRQIEASKLMVSASNYSSSYAKALLTATKDCDVKRAPAKLPAVITSADLALLEREMKTVQQDLKAVEAAYGSDMLHLVIATRYVSKLVDDPRIARYLDDNHPEILKEFCAILSATSLDTPERSESPAA